MTYQDPMIAATKLINNLTASVELLTAMNNKLQEALLIERQLNSEINNERMDHDYN